ncbi:MAG: NUDIX hydrolase [Gammaproteobacteria bacterium]|nr:NUDIX hydrolase [Gammaproteobacteria bacterium]
MNYCSNCGSEVELKIPDDDNRHRHVCLNCKTIHYHNPKIVTGCIPEQDGKILLCKRAIEPQYGKWTLPAGFMENDESTTQAALRETLEEANAQVVIHDLYTVINLPHVNQVYLLYRAALTDEGYSSGAESLEVDLYDEADIPWDELAFPVMRETLRLYFNDVRDGNFTIRTGEIIWKDDGYDFNLHT